MLKYLGDSKWHLYVLVVSPLGAGYIRLTRGSITEEGQLTVYMLGMMGSDTKCNITPPPPPPEQLILYTKTKTSPKIAAKWTCRIKYVQHGHKTAPEGSRSCRPSHMPSSASAWSLRPFPPRRPREEGVPPFPSPSVHINLVFLLVGAHSHLDCASLIPATSTVMWITTRGGVRSRSRSLGFLSLLSFSSNVSDIHSHTYQGPGRGTAAVTSSGCHSSLFA